MKDFQRKLTVTGKGQKSKDIENNVKSHAIQEE